MNWASCLLLLLTLVASQPCAKARGEAEHVVVVVWDGMRPDFITPQFTPTLHELAVRGTFFRNNHSVFITSTEVNGTALATGMLPDRSGVMANTQYSPELNWINSYGTESLDAVRRGDLLSGGHYLGAATVAEILQRAGSPTVIAGAKPVALLHDRRAGTPPAAQKDSVTLFRGQTLPRAVLEGLTKAMDIGPLPANMILPAFPLYSNAPAADPTTTTTTNDPPARSRGFRTSDSANTPDSWTTKALVRGLWRKGVPKYTLLWLSEPDAAQHEHGVGSPEAVAALVSSDKNLGVVLKALEDKGVLERTDIFVVSDHGFSTIKRGSDVIESLNRAHFTAGRQFQNPEPGDIMVVNLGGSASFYVFQHDEAVVRGLVDYLQGSDFAGVIFSRLPIEGTFPLSQVHLGATNGAPDVLVSLRWSPDVNDYDVPGMIASIEGRRGHGTHASLSRFDLHNTLIAAGPDFKKGFVSELPSGNIDLAPTVLAILGVAPPQPMDGRVLYEAMTGDEPPKLEPRQQRIEASRELGFLKWYQYLTFTRIGSAVYYDEGNGQCRLR